VAWELQVWMLQMAHGLQGVVRTPAASVTMMPQPCLLGGLHCAGDRGPGGKQSAMPGIANTSGIVALPGGLNGSIPTAARDTTASSLGESGSNKPAKLIQAFAVQVLHTRHLSIAKKLSVNFFFWLAVGIVAVLISAALWWRGSWVPFRDDDAEGVKRSEESTEPSPGGSLLQLLRDGNSDEVPGALPPRSPRCPPRSPWEQAAAGSSSLEPLTRPGSRKATSSSLDTMSSRLAIGPVLCSALVVNTKVRYLIDAETLFGACAETLYISSITGPTPSLLRAKVSVQPGGSRSLAIFSIGTGDGEVDPHVVVANDPASPSSLKVFGQRGMVFGTLEMVSDGAVLSCKGQRSMEVKRAGETGLEMTALAADGSLLATAGPPRRGLRIAPRKSATEPEANHWIMDAQPATDALLVLACMLALLILFRPG